MKGPIILLADFWAGAMVGVGATVVVAKWLIYRARRRAEERDIPMPSDPRWTRVPGVCDCGGCVILQAGDVTLSDSETSFSLTIGGINMHGTDGAQRYVEAVVSAWRRRTPLN